MLKIKQIRLYVSVRVGNTEVKFINASPTVQITEVEKGFLIDDGKGEVILITIPNIASVHYSKEEVSKSEKKK